MKLDTNLQQNAVILENLLYLHVNKDIQERLQQLHRIPSKADFLFDGIMKIGAHCR
jgi:hypothetical protein